MKPKETYQVRQHGELKFTGTKLRCYEWLHDESNGFIKNAMRYYGYKIERTPLEPPVQGTSGQK